MTSNKKFNHIPSNCTTLHIEITYRKKTNINLNLTFKELLQFPVILSLTGNVSQGFGHLNRC